MKIVETLIKEKECSGCEACVQSCPQNVLIMKQDNEGFLAPEVTDKERCVNCGLCIKACQVHQIRAIDSKSRQIGYVAQSKDRKNSKRSSSGGAFWTIAKEWIEGKNGVVFGAAVMEDHTVCHILADTVEGLKRMQGSKYVQSNIGNSYRETKRLLQEGCEVLFSGTPCQIQGLRLYLKKDYSNLFTIDIICHGVTSPLLLTDYIKKVEHHEKRKCTGVRFRYKNPLFKSGSSFYMMLMMNKGFRVIRAGKRDPYMNIYLSGYAFRESCYACQFACPKRVGDITIGDCDSHRDYPNYHPDESNSTIIINTQKADDYWSNKLAAKFEFVTMNLDREIECNKQLNKPFTRPQKRDGIYHDVLSMGYNELMKRYGQEQGWLSYIKTRIMMHMPITIRKIMASVR